MRKETEKKTEAYLRQEIERRGGFTFKLITTLVKGLPDRICLLPGGRIFFAEIKSPGKNPTRLQARIGKRLTDLGFTFTVPRSRADVDAFLKSFLNG